MENFQLAQQRFNLSPSFKLDQNHQIINHKIRYKNVTAEYIENDLNNQQSQNLFTCLSKVGKREYKIDKDTVKGSSYNYGRFKGFIK